MLLLFCFFALSSPVGVAMVKRGRKQIFRDKRTTCITAENDDFEYLRSQGIESSDFFRRSVEAFRKSKSSPIEQLKKDIDETKAKIMGYEIILHQQEAQLKELEEMAEIEAQEENEREEFEEKRTEYVISCIKMMQTSSWSNWHQHLIDAWKFDTAAEAKSYVKDVWLEKGVPETKINKFLGLN